MRAIRSVVLAAVAAQAAMAQLTPVQKVQDFQSLVSLYAKRYAPYTWKKTLLGVDILDVRNWVERVRNSKDDLEYYEIAAEYVAQLDDLHSYYLGPSRFAAFANFAVDIYDGKVLVEAIDRATLPEARYPFQVGDELVSVDGKPVDVLIDEFAKLRRRGNPSTTRRSAADLITFRSQAFVPRTSDLGETSQFVFRRANSGDLETYEIAWTKSGIPLTKNGPVPDPRLAAQSDTGDYLKPWLELTNFSASQDDHLLTGSTWSADLGAEVPRRYLLGWGSRTPSFAMPAGFQLRLGRSQADFHYSGVYQSGGLRIGYLRFPNFAPQNYTSAVAEVAQEIAFFKENTDGLVVDVMRNTGGGCYMLDAAAFLIPRPFSFFGVEIRVTMDRIISWQSALESAKRQRAPEWIIGYYEEVVKELVRAYGENRGMTESLPACTGITQSFQLPTFEGRPPLDRNGAQLAYDKPLIVLIDEFSTSAGDIFPAMLQDNGRGPLVGTRTNGAGGSISAWPAGMYSEGFATNTDTLVLRKEPLSVPGYPQSRYIENVGAHADVKLEYMTRENLMQRGRPFVEAFTQILADHIRAAAK